MTTGSINRSLGPGSGYTRVWSGGDGKGAVGGPIQWNNYTATISYYSQNKTGAGGVCAGGTYPFTPQYSNEAVFGNNDELALLERLTEQIRRHSFNLSVSVAQGSQTLQLVSSVVSRVHQSVKQLRRGRIDLAVRTLGASPQDMHAKNRRFDGRRLDPLSSKDVSATWLEMQYGWLPLYQDVYEASRAFEACTSAPRKQRFTASLQATPVETLYWDGSSYGSRYTTRSTKSRKYVYELTEQISTPRSLGLFNPAAVAWELVPFSFVADWFIPIGSYIDSLNIFPVLDGRYLVTDLGKVVGKGVPGVYHWYFNCGWIGAGISSTRITVSRVVGYGSLPVPRPEFKPLVKALSTGHLKNALALLNQML